MRRVSVIRGAPRNLEAARFAALRCSARGDALTPPLAMNVTINGQSREIPDGLTVRGLLDHLGLTEGPVAVEIGREIVPRANHATHPVAEGDVLELVHLVGGG